jgi:hypothetical protein
MAKFILSLDKSDVPMPEATDVSFSTFFDFEEGMELTTIVPFSLWQAYKMPKHIVVELPLGTEGS